MHCCVCVCVCVCVCRTLRAQKDVTLGAGLCPTPSNAPPAPNTGCTVISGANPNNTQWRGALSGLNPLSGGVILSVQWAGVFANVTDGASSKTFSINFRAEVRGNADADPNEQSGWVSVYNDTSTVAVVCTSDLQCTEVQLFNMNEVACTRRVRGRERCTPTHRWVVCLAGCTAGLAGARQRWLQTVPH